MAHSQLLRPLSVGEIIDRAFRIYRNHFSSLISIAALVIAPISILLVLSQIVLGNTLLVNALQNLFVLCFVQGSLTYAVACAYLGQPFSIGSAYRSALQRYGSLWGAFILQALAIGVPAALLACGLIAMTRAQGGGGAIVAILLTVPFAVYLSTRWLVMVPSIMQEQIGATQGLSRSWKLTHSVFWRVLGVLIVLYLLTLVVAELPVIAVTYGLAYLSPGNPVGSVVALILTELSLIVTLPLSTGVIVLLYYDLRVRREGYDLELQAQELSASSSEPVSFG